MIRYYFFRTISFLCRITALDRTKSERNSFSNYTEAVFFFFSVHHTNRYGLGGGSRPINWIQLFFKRLEIGHRYDSYHYAIFFFNFFLLEIIANFFFFFNDQCEKQWNSRLTGFNLVRLFWSPYYFNSRYNNLINFSLVFTFYVFRIRAKRLVLLGGFFFLFCP